MSNRRKRAPPGRRQGAPFLRLWREMTESETFGNLSPHAVKLLVEIGRQYRGNNNGDLSAPWSKLKRRGWRSKSTLWAAIKELVDSGFIVVTRLGGKHHVCTLYGITWEAIDDCKGKHDYPPEIVASHLWKRQEKSSLCVPQEFAMRTPEPEIERKVA